MSYLTDAFQRLYSPRRRPLKEPLPEFPEKLFYKIPQAVRSRLPRPVHQFIRVTLCPHTHTFRYKMDGARWVNYVGKHKGEHPGLELCGCYLCGKVFAHDYKA